MKKNLKWIIAILFLFAFVIIAIYLSKNSSFNLDNYFYNFLAKNHSDGLTLFMKYISKTADWWFLVGVVIILFIFIKEKKYPIIIAINLVAIYLFSYFFKLSFSRERPTINPLILETGFSFPSGHAMVGTAFYGLLIYFIYKKIKNKFWKWILIILLSLLIVIVCISRVYLGVHYTSDIIAGVTFSLGYLIIIIAIIKQRLGDLLC